MSIIFDWYLWMLPLFGIFELMLISKKKIYASEHTLPNSPLNYDIADDYRVAVGFAILVFLPFIFVSANRGFAFGDTHAYRGMFLSWPDSIGEINLTGEERYPGFIYFTVFIKQFIANDYRVWFFIIAAIQCICLASTYRRYTAEIVLCAYFFLMSDFQGWMNNGMRQFLVATIMFALTPLILDKKVGKCIIFIAVALLLYYTHVSVIIALPVYFVALGKPMNKRTMLLIGAIVLAILFVGQFTDLMSDALSETNYKASTQEMTSTDNGTNIVRVLFFSIPAALAIIFKKKIPSDAPAVINFSINMSLVGSAFYFLSAFTNGVSIGRLPIYFTLYNYILIPWEIKHFFKKEDHQFVFVVLIIVYFIFFTFQMITWGI